MAAPRRQRWPKLSEYVISKTSLVIFAAYTYIESRESNTVFTRLAKVADHTKAFLWDVLGGALIQLK